MLTSNLAASKLTQIVLIGAAVAAVAVADVCLKQAARQGALVDAIRSPWTWAAIALYLFQIVLFVVVFVNGWKLSHVSLMQLVLYAVITLGAGVLLFGEVFSLKQLLGSALAIAGVTLLSL